MIRAGLARWLRLAAIRRWLVAMVSCVMLSACATPADDPAYDPLEGFNRHMFAINQAVDTMLIRPAAVVYREMVPWPIKDMLTNFLSHLTLPLTIVHDLLQGKTDRAGVAFGRLFLNTFVGVGGLFDIATPAGFVLHTEDAGQTLAVHGVEPGPYLVLPLLGPSSFRDAAGLLADAVIDPFGAVTYGVNRGLQVRWGLAGARGLVKREELIEPLDQLKDGSIDYYAAVRSAYRQRRQLEVRDGAPPPLKPDADPLANFD